MATLNFKGKGIVANHHLAVPFSELVPDDKKSTSAKPKLDDNLVIHGDNLLALKALLPTYTGKVKCIYIDPPYNTGHEGWAYNDNVNNPMIKNWLGKVVDAEDLTRHDKWLCMMMPRLKLLRELLSDEGVIFAAIDDNEVHHLRELMDEIFGEENFIAEMVVEGAFKNDARQVGVNHEYVLVYARMRAKQPTDWSIAKVDFEPVLTEVERLKKKYGEDYESASRDLGAWFQNNKATPAFAHRRFRFIDKHGAYKEDDPTAPGGRKFDLVNPKNGKKIPLRANRGWVFDQKKFEELVNDGRISFVTDTSIMVRRYLHETNTVTPQSVIYQPARSASERLSRLMGRQVFEFPKDEFVIKTLIEMATEKDSVILDSFAGSGTTAHAVLALNKEDGGNRRFILVETEDYADKITAERVRRVSKGVKGAKDEALKKGLGGTFSYFELGKPIDEAGLLSGKSLPSYEEMARYIFHVATGESFDAKKLDKKRGFIGSSKEFEVYLIYEPNVAKLKELALTLPFVESLGKPKGKKRLVFAPTKYLAPEDMTEHHVEFAQLPFEIYRRLS